MAKQTYVTGQVLTAAQQTTLQTNDYNQTVSAKVASYVLVAADVGTRITMSNVGATTLTVNTGLFAAGDTLFYTNIGAGATTITAGTATVSTASSLVLAQYDSGRLYFTSTGVAIWEKYQGASAGASALTKISAATFSGVATTGTTFDGIFTGTYKKYLVVLSNMTAATSSAVLYLQTRVSAVTKTTNYYSGCTAMNYASTKTDTLASNASQWGLCRLSDTVGAQINITFTGVGNSSEYPLFSSQGMTGYEGGYTIGGGEVLLNQIADGIILSASTGNISGTVTVYGLAN